MGTFISDPNDPRSHGKLVNPIQIMAPAKDNEDKLYIILIKADTEEYDGRYEIHTGRSAMYECIQRLADVINIHESIIITETLQTETRSGNTKYFLINIPDAKSVYDFCRQIAHLYDDDFDIENYNNMEEELTEAQQNYAINTGSEAARLWEQVVKERQDSEPCDYAFEPKDDEYNV